MNSLLDLNYADLEELLEKDGVKSVHALQLWGAVQRKAVTHLEGDKFPPPLRDWAKQNIGPRKKFQIEELEQVHEVFSEDGLTRKYLLKLEDGQVIEAVLMEYAGRFTACISSQAGCAMACVFCATGQMGFVRHLRSGEIVAQVQHLRRVLKQTHPGRRLRNLVLMGMGEPLHNYEGVMKALGILSDCGGASIGPSRISISTVGVVPAILRLAEEKRPYRLAVSLHGSTEDERSSLVPVSKKWDLQSLIDACRKYGRITGKKIFFEWTLIAGKNDSAETAGRLVELLRGIKSHVNLIPLNPTPGFYGTASEAGLRFQETLRNGGIPCTFRQRRGIDVAAGCGMLKAERLGKKEKAGR